MTEPEDDQHVSKYDGQEIVDSLPPPESIQDVAELAAALTFAAVYATAKHTEQIATLPEDKFDMFLERVQTKWKQAFLMIMGMEVQRIQREMN